MMDCTDRHGRYFLRLLSKNVMLYTEMVATKSAIHGDRKKILSFNEMEKPLALQVGGSDYKDLIKCSKKENYDIILCEVNIYPQNPGSIRFHKRFDFIECGSQFTEGGKKQVQFFFREL